MTAAMPGTRRASWRVLVPALVGAAVAVALGVFGRTHTPTPIPLFSKLVSSVIEAKVWLASIVVVLALFQLVTALWMYGKLPLGRAPHRLGAVHRASGTAAFVVSLPVAYQCLYALGFQSYDTRVLLHSLLGCLFYGAFAAKVLTLHTRRLPGWTLPVAGGLLFTSLVGVWLTSALWYLTQ